MVAAELAYRKRTLFSSSLKEQHWRHLSPEKKKREEDNAEHPTNNFH